MGPTRRLTLREAAEALGISKEAVRKRAIRGSLPTDKDPDGRVYVYLDTVEDVHDDDSVSGTSLDPRNQLIAQLQSEVEAWREESRRKDHIIAGLVERLPPQLEPPREEPAKEPESVADEQQGRGPVPDAGGPMAEGAERPWWRRVLGG